MQKTPSYCSLFKLHSMGGKQVREHRWSLDACVGYARLHKLFDEAKMVCTKTLYNEMETGNLPSSLFEMPEVLKRKRSKRKSRVHKRLKGCSIDERPNIVDDRTELGHWEADIVVGRRNGKEAVILTLVERVTNNYLAIRILGKNSEAVMDAMKVLYGEYSELFSRVFKTITTDNGSEFDDTDSAVGHKCLLRSSILILGAAYK